MAIDNYPAPRLPISNAMWRYNAVGGETTLSGYDSFGQPLQYTVNSEQLFLNGVMLVRGSDYAATTGTTITGLTALSAGDFVEILTYSNFNVATLAAPNITGSILNSQLNKSSITLGSNTVSLGDTVSSISGLTIDGTTNVIHTNRGSTNPTVGNVVGDIFWNTTSSALQLWNGTAWISFAAPGAPVIGTATDLGSGRVYGNSAASISFTPNSGGGNATQFFVTSTPGSLTSYGTSSPITITGLTSGTSYTFTVSAVGSFGNSPASNTTGALTVTSVPQAPTIGTATAGAIGSSNASVAFTAGATGGSTVTGYTVTSTPGSLTGTGTSSPITVSNLVPGTSYTFAVVATNANGSSLASSGSNSIIGPLLFRVGQAQFGVDNSATNSGTNTGSAFALTTTNATYSTPAKFGSQALAFAGSGNQYATLSTDIAYTATNSKVYTLAFWLYARGDNAAGRTYLADFRSDATYTGNTNSYWGWDSTGSMFCPNGQGGDSGPSVKPTFNTWEHWAMVANGSSCVIYRNSSAIFTGTGSTGYGYAGPITLGTYYGVRGNTSGNYFLNGLMDNIYFNTVALSGTEISNLAASTVGF